MGASPGETVSSHWWEKACRHFHPELGWRERRRLGCNCQTSTPKCHKERNSYNSWPRSNHYLWKKDEGSREALSPSEHRLCSAGHGVSRWMAWGSNSPSEKVGFLPGAPHHLLLLSSAAKEDSSTLTEQGPKPSASTSGRRALVAIFLWTYHIALDSYIGVHILISLTSPCFRETLSTFAESTCSNLRR